MHIAKYSYQILLAALIAVMLSACSGSRPAFLGSEQSALTLCPSSPNCVSSLDTENETHKIAPIPYDDFEQTRRNLVDLIRTNPASELIVDSPNYLYAEYTSALMRFVDDVEFLFDQERNKIDVRSASRLGHSDFDVNRERIEHIRSQLLGEEK